MAKLQDLIQKEIADSRSAADAAAHGRSITGHSGRHSEVGRPGEMFGERAEPIGSQEQQLAWPTRPGYRRYWFNDRPGRISRAIRAGYAHVIDEDTGGNVSKNTDTVDGRGRSSYLMETPIEWYQEDMARQAADLEARLNDIRQGQAGPGAEDQRYVPSRGISITGR